MPPFATIVGALKVMDLILAFGLPIAPGAVSFLLTRSFGAMLPTFVALSVGAGLPGFYLDSAPGPTIVLLMMAALSSAGVGRAMGLAR